MYERLYELGAHGCATGRVTQQSFAKEFNVASLTTTSAPVGGVLDLDVTIVSGPDRAAALLLSSTDDGCDTVPGGDC